MGLAFLLSARTLSRDRLLVPYREDWRPVLGEGFAAYARRVATPYAAAAAGHFDPALPTHTERLLDRLGASRSTSPGPSRRPRGRRGSRPR